MENNVISLNPLKHSELINTSTNGIKKNDPNFNALSNSGLLKIEFEITGDTKYNIIDRIVVEHIINLTIFLKFGTIFVILFSAIEREINLSKYVSKPNLPIIEKIIIIVCVNTKMPNALAPKLCVIRK